MKETCDFLETRNSEECASTANASPCQQDLAMRHASWVKKVDRVGKWGLPILREMAEASGVKASLAALWKRAIEGRALSAPPPPGTPLLCSLARVVEHSGIYLGAGRVAELKGDGQLREVSLFVFLNGDESDMYNPRTGYRIYAACDAHTGSPLSSSGAAANARRFISEHQVTEYNIITNNCHLFATSCIIGEYLLGDLPKDDDRSGPRWIVQADKALSAMADNEANSIAKLETAIVEHLNFGRPIAWLPIASMKGFRYELSQEKITHLQLHGKKGELK